MDVHKEAIVIVVLNSSGKQVMETILETKASSILQFIHGLRGELHVTWEEGTWAAWLYDLLRTLRELARSYQTIGKDMTRVMNRLKALYRGWAIPCAGTQVYAPRYREEWLNKIPQAGVRRRAELLYESVARRTEYTIRRAFASR